MSPARFSFLLPDGSTVTGPVQGNGGMVDVARLLKAQRIATSNRVHGIYEPAPGCVAVFPSYSFEGNGEPVIAPLSGLIPPQRKHRHDFRDGDVCSGCDAVRGAA